MSNENEELNEILETIIEGESRHSGNGVSLRSIPGYPLTGRGRNEPTNMTGNIQWTTKNDKVFVPAGKTVEELIPGMYNIKYSDQVGVYFEKVEIRTLGLIRFKESSCDKIVKEIQKFWDNEKIFKQYKLNYKRGILMWGNAGSGKSCTIQLICEDVISRGGVCVPFEDPDMFKMGLRAFREIQKETPIVVIMEDIDEILEEHNESDVLNILDGLESVEKCLFLATTNYPEKLGARIVNRPSRFDKRFKIGYPSAETRRVYLESLMRKEDKKKIDIDKVIKDTDEFTLAHLKELFIAVIILGDNYSDALKTVSSMKEKIMDSDKKRLGFGM